jgi:hypothetical protein
MNKITKILLLAILVFSQASCNLVNDTDSIDNQVDKLLAQMTLDEKIGQLVQKNGDHPNLDEMIRAGGIGSVLNEVNPNEVSRFQNNLTNPIGSGSIVEYRFGSGGGSCGRY